MGFYSLSQLFFNNKIILKNGEITDSFLNKLKSIFFNIQFDNKTEKKDLNLYLLYYF